MKKAKKRKASCKLSLWIGEADDAWLKAQAQASGEKVCVIVRALIRAARVNNIHPAA